LVAAGLAALAVAERAGVDGTSRELKLALFGVGAAIAVQIVRCRTRSSRRSVLRPKRS
jgi:hypothetical protein